MSTFSKQLLSGTPASGRQIKVVPIITPGTLIHTAIAGATDFDEVWLYATNFDTVDRTLTIEWGGVATPDDLIGPLTIGANAGLVTVIPGWALNGGLEVRAFAEVANLIMVGGFVNRIAA